MNKYTTPNTIKKTLATSAFVLALSLPGMAQDYEPNCITKKNANWHETSSWAKGSLPNSNDKAAIINVGNSAVVDQPVDEDINVVVGNGNSAQPDGTLIINADFKVTEIGVALHSASSGRVEQNSGVVTLEMLSIASTHPDPMEGAYDLEEGKIETKKLEIGTMGPGILTIKGTGEVFSVGGSAKIAANATLRFLNGAGGFPTMNFGSCTIESGASLEVEGNNATKPGKYALILADEPLAARFNVRLLGFAAGKAKLLENEPGVVLEVK